MAKTDSNNHSKKTFEKNQTESPVTDENYSTEAEKVVPNSLKAKIVIEDQISNIEIDKIVPDPNQPRKFFDNESSDNLKNSIKSTSLHNPILVYKSDQDPESYVIVDGQRRFQACKDLGHSKIQCRIVTSDSKGYQILALAQNIHREDLLPIEKANAFATLLSNMEGDNESVKQKELTGIVNLAESTVSELIKISKLDDEIKQEALLSKEWSGRKLLQLAKIKNEKTRFNKFKEFKAAIDKKTGINATGVDDSAEHDDSPQETKSPSDKSISQIQKLIERLEKLFQKNKSSFEEKQIEKIKSELKEFLNNID